ncbi:MAG: alanine dehydrogenase [Zetaproteobacteria bacterium]|nr:MAG: alanine dehydrogenase [Zetaproteobacteria bacterium]
MQIRTIGVPREIKNRERRVALTPIGAKKLIERGFRVIVEQGAGEGAGFSDADYRRHGAIVADREAAWGADLVVKVKEPLSEEYPYLRPGLVLFTYLHLAAAPELLRVLIERRVAAFGYETLEGRDGRLVLLAPMSRIAGRLAVQMGAFFLQAENLTPHKGKGVLLGGLDGRAAKVVILGCGHVGTEAARAAAGLGAGIVAFDVRAEARQRLNTLIPSARVLPPDAKQLQAELAEADLLVGAALVPGARTPRILDEKMLGRMPEGGVFVDVAIDQGGTSSTSRPTTFEQPTYREAGVIHCCLPNMPAAVPRTSTLLLTEATWPYVLRLAELGVEGALADPELKTAANVIDGRIVHPALASTEGGC